MNEPSFQAIARAIQGVTGLALTADKDYLLASRLAPMMRRRGLRTLGELAQRLPTADGPALIREMAEATTTNETSFFRDTAPFTQLTQHLLPSLGGGPLRIWSAACSSGQEAYSIAMATAESGFGPRVSVLGTDYSPAMVERARAGLYSAFEVQRGLAVPLRDRWMAREGDQWRVAAELRRRCRFEPGNLLSDLSALGSFEVVFLRNVLIYFDPPTKERVVNACAARLAAGGFLVLGASETLVGLRSRLVSTPHHGVWRLA
jgi:chemotaxis protein methyltransferase CheR